MNPNLNIELMRVRQAEIATMRRHVDAAEPDHGTARRLPARLVGGVQRLMGIGRPRPAVDKQFA